MRAVDAAFEATLDDHRALEEEVAGGEKEAMEAMSAVDGGWYSAEIVSKRVTLGGKEQTKVHFTEYDTNQEEWVSSEFVRVQSRPLEDDELETLVPAQKVLGFHKDSDGSMLWVEGAVQKVDVSHALGPIAVVAFAAVVIDGEVVREAGSAPLTAVDICAVQTLAEKRRAQQEPASQEPNTAVPSCSGKAPVEAPQCAGCLGKKKAHTCGRSRAKAHSKEAVGAAAPPPVADVVEAEEEEEEEEEEVAEEALRIPGRLTAVQAYSSQPPTEGDVRKKAKGGSVYTGVTRNSGRSHKGHWHARIGAGERSQSISLGSFVDDKEAARAYDAAIRARLPAERECLWKHGTALQVRFCLWPRTRHARPAVLSHRLNASPTSRVE
jgi:hypothetical protein